MIDRVNSKKCPCCETQMIYSLRSNLLASIRKNLKCKRCSAFQRDNSKRVFRKHERNCPKCNILLQYRSISKFYAANRIQSLCRSCGAVERYKRINTDAIDCNGVLYYGRNCPECDKEILYKQREHRNRLLHSLCRLCFVSSRRFIFPNYNPEACRIIDEYGQVHGYSFQHAENGGEHCIKELGYWVDGYDKKKNVVIEYYESHHKYSYEADRIREQKISNILGCEFIKIGPGNYD